MTNINLFTGIKVMITAGPTREAIDPVRFISNHSTGKMGYAIAEEFCSRGADVTLISGPVNITTQNARIRSVQVTTTAEMYEACCLHFPESNIAVLSAAVADYTPKFVASQKIKKKDNEFSIELVKTVDIAAELGKRKQPGQMTIGFALETENELENARKKLRSKNLDMIVLNSLQNPGAGFGHETNQVTILNRDATEKSFALKSKKEVAKDIVQCIMHDVFSHFDHGLVLC
ncbi:bifunctional phosphopantothenoylcysteine decarboxylase/phosphopantothenate--cysteine ligase CoaBC [Dyadobacter arcticus]|uniref:Phosphopantothenoylcysteine decarboxylase/phosphopantothenate--cysteine ligase n=1 Tax=Dyadobacter arcticus TaxID=1078754 RepID=A0ABX0UJK9_9BACT|nr:phosphopantothenoylcysteine decarboxylase/phosphopantothenate--cysteine ligase [Dyadobacter arcticus]